ncbi:MAG: hypothetical protein ACTHOU_12640 [Aureliella sp.]|jgi:hypothetical protein
MSTKPTTQKLVESARGEDRPIDAKRPGVPYVLVAAYPIMLVVALLAILAYFLFMNWQ